MRCRSSAGALCFASPSNLCKLLAMQQGSKFSVGLVQMKASADADENLNRAVSFVEQAAAMGAQVVCLPELFRSQYFCQREDASLFDLAEPVPGPTTQRLGRAAKRSLRETTIR